MSAPQPRTLYMFVVPFVARSPHASKHLPAGADAKPCVWQPLASRQLLAAAAARARAAGRARPRREDGPGGRTGQGPGRLRGSAAAVRRALRRGRPSGGSGTAVHPTTLENTSYDVLSFGGVYFWEFLVITENRFVMYFRMGCDSEMYCGAMFSMAAGLFPPRRRSRC